MNHKTITKFIKKIAVRIIIFTFVMFVVTAVSQSFSVIVTNELALSQMRNDNAAFVMMNAYNRIKPIVGTLYIIITIWFVYTLGRDTYKFVKTNNNENDKEN